MARFENWQRISDELNIEFPECPSPLSVEDIPPILKSINNIQNASQLISFQQLLEVSEIIARDILVAEKPNDDRQELIWLQYLQFEVSIAPIGCAINCGRFNHAFDWIFNGLSGEIGTATQREFFVERPFNFMAKLVDALPSSWPHSFLKWSEYFFYYCRSQSALHAPASEIAKLLAGTVFRLPVSQDLAIDAAVSLMCWAQEANHEIAPEIAWQLKDLFLSTNTSQSDKATIAKAFSTRSSDLIGDAHHKWAKIVIGDYANLLVQHEPFQFIFATFQNVRDWDSNFSELIQAAQSYSKGVHEHFPLYSEWVIALDQRSNLLNPVASMARAYDRRADFTKILAAWYGGDIDIAANEVCVFLPTTISGIGILGSTSEIIPFKGRYRDIEDAVYRMNDITNTALGTTRTVQAGSELVEAPKRPGQPCMEFSEEFEHSLLDFYDMGRIAEMITDSKAVTCFPHNLHPIQPLLSKETGMCLPLTSSLRAPLPDRKIENVAIWASCDDYYSEMEALSIKRFLEKKGIFVRIHLGRELNKANFLQMYQCDRYDFIHVIGHGEFDHWELGSSYILINEEERVSVDELLEIDLTDHGRRLLSLNICDGGVSDGLGGIQKLGLAPSLASPSQATVSHLWPVEPRVAAAFGLILCAELSSSASPHFEIYERTLKNIRLPWVKRVEELRTLFEGDILERLENYEAEDCIFNWASPVFFQ